jgi:DNA-binding NtrC family response regulator
MSKILVSWIGQADLNAASQSANAGLGPVATALEGSAFSRVVLLCNYPEEKVAPYRKWLKSKTKCPIEITRVKLSSPTEFGEIYREAVRVVDGVLERPGPPAQLTFHISPGTPAMQTIWVILAKTKYDAELIESSPQSGVRTPIIPFEISAEIIPSLLRRPDEQLERLSAGLPPEAPEFSDILHRSAEMQKVVARARLVAPRNFSVLIEGESGTGKELLARAIHETSPRRKKEAVIVNCGAISPTLIESELFGHMKGSFTDATKDRAGYFEAADGGTIFLDEIGELPKAAQVKLLRVLAEGKVTRLGSTTPKEVDVRIIAATNRTLSTEVLEGRFREDLYYRLAVVIIRIPPVRKREGDVGMLIDKLLEKQNKESAELGLQTKVLSPAARNTLLKYPWPGNVRELQNTLVRVSVLST